MHRKKDGRLSSIVGWISFGLVVAAVIKELSLPREDRTWHGRLLGIPVRLPPADHGEGARATLVARQPEPSRAARFRDGMDPEPRPAQDTARLPNLLASGAGPVAA